MTEPTSSPPNPGTGMPGDATGPSEDPTAPLWPPAAQGGAVPPGAVPPGSVPPGDRAAGDGEERDRVWVHFVWEAVLLVLVIGLAVAVWVSTGHSPVDDRFFAIAGALGLVAVGFALSLRAAVPNLAVGVIAASAGGLCALLSADYGWGFWPALVATLGAGLLAGVVLAVIVVGLSVPAWPASLGLSIATFGLAIGIAEGRRVGARVPGLPFVPPGWLVFAVFVVLSVVGGAIWLIPAVRRTLSGTRRAADPARYGGWGAAVGGTLALVGSTMLATVGGIVAMMQTRAVFLVDNTTYLALAGVLLGGVSVFGRRAGVAGTVLGVLFVLLLQRLALLNGIGVGWLNMLTGIMIIMGLVVSRGLEAVGRKRPADVRPPASMPWSDAPPGQFPR